MAGWKGKGTRIVRGWHGATFYLAHQSNINELMTSQGGRHQYLATLRSATTWCQMSESIAGGGGVVTNHYQFSQNYGEEKEQTFAYNCQHVTMIDLTQHPETQLNRRRNVAFKNLILNMYQFPPQIPRYSDSVIPALVNILQARQTHGLLSPSLVANQ